MESNDQRFFSNFTGLRSLNQRRIAFDHSPSIIQPSRTYLLFSCQIQTSRLPVLMPSSLLYLPSMTSIRCLLNIFHSLSVKYLPTKLWDEQIPYVQHAYNRDLHSSTQSLSFETCFGYLPKVPLDLMYGRDADVNE
jgi:hypothetical protein